MESSSLWRRRGGVRTSPRRACCLELIITSEYHFLCRRRRRRLRWMKDRTFPSLSSAADAFSSIVRKEARERKTKIVGFASLAFKALCCNYMVDTVLRAGLIDPFFSSSSAPGARIGMARRVRLRAFPHWIPRSGHTQSRFSSSSSSSLHSPSLMAI